VPNYDYRCSNDHIFEVWQQMSDEPGAVCPDCGEPAQRMFFPAGIVFKGSGFYKTDSRRSSGNGSSGGSAGSGGSGDSAGSGGSSSTSTGSAPSGAGSGSSSD
jgi:putative FmdB family regulatory protein